MIPKKVVDNRKKNPTREIKKEVAEEVCFRDKMCIICRERAIQEIHHVWFGGQKQLDKGRNGADRLVGLCNICHHELHYGTKGLGYREITINYLQGLK